MKIKFLNITTLSKPIIISELGINHEGSLNTAFKIVDAAFKSGGILIKHQTHIVEDEMSIEATKVIPGNSKVSIYEIMKRCSLNEADEFKLMKYVQSKGMIFISTPFSRAAVDRLEKFNVPAYKIGSGEMNNYPLIEYIASKKKPMIISTGMNSIDSIKKTVKILKNYNIDFALLHTTNIYPTPFNLVRLGAMQELKKEFPEIPIGLSDHTINNTASIAAMALGASIIERHFTDTKRRKGPDIICSMTPKELKELIKLSDEIFQMRGGRKVPAKEEQVTMNFAFSSIVSINFIKKGEKFSIYNIWVKRPSIGGIPAEKFYELIGKTANKDIEFNRQIKFEDFN
jgi:N-acetylneuraminate synthase